MSLRTMSSRTNLISNKCEESLPHHRHTVHLVKLSLVESVQLNAMEFPHSGLEAHKGQCHVRLR